MRSFRERSPVLVGIVSIVAVTLAIGFAFSINRFPFLRGVYTISADLEDAAGVVSGNEVRLAGVKVGRVTGIELTVEAARIDMEIANDVELPRDTRLEVKLKTLLGQKFIDLQVPGPLTAGARPAAGELENGDVIPLSQTQIPFDIYQAATQGTEVLEAIDKDALRDLLDTLAGTFGASADELRRALVGLDDVGRVLGPKGRAISRLLRNLRTVTKTLGDGGSDLEGILDNAADVLGVLAEQRQSISSLLAATNDLGANLGTLIQVAEGSISTGFSDLDSLLTTATTQLDAIERALQELGISQELFAAPGGFGRFLEANACAVTTADTCVPGGSPEDPGLPVHNVQPSPAPRSVTR